ncbi:uncharacterized protein MYCFIDRAFT_132791 [Pseudocercospora fijiensis CIRAD86]|uniref:EthD domain-containing protein n=1 Tax=Pseudocercospora fijiensis (strain CIRAD86) TaxID=383855 RepID=M3B9N6_PSEFD|nr:uncharacterized protein MYCFIDRAFT_132791 [Pseudocercospora fijiensis CIRAD86]EME85973.1 hypothetical protein MYCFIDRAFT_132791 [Pseudocercospora fijiensis CIRAD86]
MPVVTTVMYPNEDDATFDLKYYTETHMALVDKHWKELGLIGWSISNGHPSGTKPLYSVACTLVWQSREHAEKAMAHESTQQVFGDVPNFSNKEPILLAGDVVKTSGLPEL